MLRRLYDWCVDAADKPYARWTLGVVSFAESSFFPIPPDVMLIPMALARPDKAYSYALSVHLDLGRWAVCSATRSARCSTIRSGCG